MNTQAWRYPIALFLIAAVTTIPLAAHAVIITYDISDTGLSGEVQYDDSSSTAGAGILTGWTLYAITSFTATYDPVPTTWDLTDHTGSDLFAFAVDLDGNLGLLDWDSGLSTPDAAYFTNGAGYELIFGWGIGGSAGEATFSETRYFVYNPAGERLVSELYGLDTSVDEPNILALLCLGFAVLGLTRRMKKTQ